MTSVCTSQKHRHSRRYDRSGWVRVAAILGALVFCLALAGPPMKAGVLSAKTAGGNAEFAARASTLDRTTIMSFVDRALGPAASLSNHTFELAGLLVLGLSLIGGGRALRHRPMAAGARPRMPARQEPREPFRAPVVAAVLALRRSAR